VDCFLELLKERSENSTLLKSFYSFGEHFGHFFLNNLNQDIWETDLVFLMLLIAIYDKFFYVFFYNNRKFRHQKNYLHSHCVLIIIGPS